MSVVELIERWARWRVYRVGTDLGWPKRDSIGRALSGMPSTKCIVCDGKGRITEHDADGRPIKIECKICAGQGKLAMDPDPNKANPAFIHATRGRDSYDDDPTSQRIDYIVCTELTESERSVLFMEYAGNGTQRVKAQKRGISQGYFSKILSKAEEKIVFNLE